MQDRIREILGNVAPLAVALDKVSDHDDLYDAGLTSFASVQLMLALESTFDVEFPEAMLTRRTFSSIAAIANSIAELVPQPV